MTTLRKVIATLLVLLLVPLLWWQITLYAARSVLAAPDLPARVLAASGLRAQLEERLAHDLAERLAQVAALRSVRFSAEELRTLAAQVVAASRLQLVVDARLQLTADAALTGFHLGLPVREVTPVLTLSGAQAALLAGLQPLLAQKPGAGGVTAEQVLAALDLGPIAVDAVAQRSDLAQVAGRAAAAGARLRAAVAPTALLWWVIAALLLLLVLLNLDGHHVPFAWAGVALLLGGLPPLLGARALQWGLAAGTGPAARLVLAAVAAAVRGLALWAVAAGLLSLLAAFVLRRWRRRRATVASG